MCGGPVYSITEKRTAREEETHIIFIKIRESV
jgi:hypothetical protein